MEHGSRCCMVPLRVNVDKSEVDADEFRVWEELKHDWRFNRWQIVNRLRTEQRYFIDQDEMIYRFRYYLAADYRVADKWKAIAGNELMCQSAKEERPGINTVYGWVGNTQLMQKTRCK